MIANKKVIILITMTISLGVLWATQRTPSEKTLDPSQSSGTVQAVAGSQKGKTKDHDHQDIEDDPTNATQGTQVDRENELRASTITDSFNFEEESKAIEELATNYPKSKEQLIKKITVQDVFKQQNITVKPHSIHEITQRQMGAVKVLSLKTLLEKESSKHILLQDLERIITSSQDPTLREIAKAAKKSVQNDRPFVRDMIDGLSNIKE